MSIEFLLVTYPTNNVTVLGDGDIVGVANHMLMLPAGSYDINLSDAAAKPASQPIVLAGTSAVRPLVIGFSQ
jgi:hypothetical protein